MPQQLLLAACRRPPRKLKAELPSPKPSALTTYVEVSQNLTMMKGKQYNCCRLRDKCTACKWTGLDSTSFLQQLATQEFSDKQAKAALSKQECRQADDNCAHG
eukprot:3508141-Amphidinium_carterae.1